MTKLVLSFVAIGGLFWSLSRAMHSGLFAIESIQVRSSSENPPVNEQAIIRLSGLSPGSSATKTNLFELDLKAVEKRILSSDWIREVRLQKKIPRSLLIDVVFRQPKAILQQSNGLLKYLDAGGKSFGQISLAHVADVPVIHLPELKIEKALHLIEAWERSPLAKVAWISSVQWDQERGFRLLVVYSLGSKAGAKARAMIDLGDETEDGPTQEKLLRLSSVIRYLIKNSIAVHQVWADIGKKVVVKTSLGS